MQDPTAPTGNEEQSPRLCPYGHVLGPGHVLVGWLPCTTCTAVQAIGGHRIYHCRACLDLADKRQTICHFPPHVPKQNDPART